MGTKAGGLRRKRDSAMRIASRIQQYLLAKRYGNVPGERQHLQRLLCRLVRDARTYNRAAWQLRAWERSPAPSATK
jgi:hypothetical protein